MLLKNKEKQMNMEHKLAKIVFARDDERKEHLKQLLIVAAEKNCPEVVTDNIEEALFVKEQAGRFATGAVSFINGRTIVHLNWQAKPQTKENK
tara:strand:- start:728 stop:1006 length:279 start_codon:yes stop_codon:yes gene_type:complete